jgi:hypothetical protein
MTLIELIAAIAIAGIVLLGAILLLDVVDDNSMRLRRDVSQSNDSVATAHLVAQLLSNASLGSDSMEGFAGSSRDLSFWTRCADPRGWNARCHSTLTLADARDGAVLRASARGANEQTLGRYRASAYFQYFDVDHERWRASWNATATMPAALAIVSDRDSTIYSIGAARE